MRNAREIYRRQDLTTVRLYGQLGKEFGTTWRIAAGSTGELIAAIESQRPGFKRRILDMKCAFRVRRDGKLLNKRQFQQPPGRLVSITPVPQGSKTGGILQVILGVVLIIVGAIMSIYTAGSGTPVIMLGVSMLLSGIASMLSPQPQKQKDKPNRQSYVFDGPVNVMQQGGPVPVLYGRMTIGSVCVSAGITAREYGTNQIANDPSSTPGAGRGPIIILAA